MSNSEYSASIRSILRARISEELRLVLIKKTPKSEMSVTFVKTSEESISSIGPEFISFATKISKIHK